MTEKNGQLPCRSLTGYFRKRRSVFSDPSQYGVHKPCSWTADALCHLHRLIHRRGDGDPVHEQQLHCTHAQDIKDGGFHFGDADRRICVDIMIAQSGVLQHGKTDPGAKRSVTRAQVIFFPGCLQGLRGPRVKPPAAGEHISSRFSGGRNTLTHWHG